MPRMVSVCGSSRAKYLAAIAGLAVMATPAAAQIKADAVRIGVLTDMADIFATVQQVNARGVSIFMIEQNATEALRISDTCLVMANGRVRLCAAAGDVLGMQDLHSLYLGDAREQAALA